VNRLNRYAGLWEDQERAMRTPTSYRDAEWDLNTSPPMQWHFGPPPSGWGSYLSGANLPTARGQVVDARLFYTPPSVRFGRGFSGLGAVFPADGVTANAGMRDVQTQLARLGFLFNEESPQGIDGKWGPRTELALRFASRYVRFEGVPWIVAGSGRTRTVDISDSLIEALRNAPVAPAGTEGLVSATPEVASSSDGGSGSLGIALVFIAAVAAAGYYYGR
jgi:hypothetical protein